MEEQTLILELLDDDLLLKIFEKLPPFDRKTWSVVCKQFYELESQTRTKLQVLRDDMLQRVLNRYRNVEQLDLSLCSRVNDLTLQLVSAVLWPRLSCINLSRLARFGYVGLSALATRCENLVEMDVSSCLYLGDKEAAAISMAKNLRILKMVKCPRISDLGLSWIAVRCSKLTHLNLRWCTGLTDLGIELVAIKCKDIRFLDISFLPITNKCLASFTQLAFLDTLLLVGCVGIDDRGLIFLRDGCTCLQRLNISKCHNLSCGGLISLASGSLFLQQLNLAYCIPQVSNAVLCSFCNFERLQSIRLDGSVIPSSGMECMRKSCTSLKEIGLSKCSGITDEGIASLVSGCRNLKVIDITCCRLLTDNAISAIANCCKDLNCLKMESCSLISERGFSYMGDNLLSLQELDLTDSSITNEGLKSISKCTELVTLKLGFCVNISDEGLIHVGNCCSKLREIDFYRSTGIGDNGLIAVARGCPSLKIVNVSYCIRITNNGLRALEHLKELHNLEIRGCFNVTSAGISAVAMGCKRLVELDVKRCYHVDDAGFLTVVECCLNLRQINISYCPITNAAFLALVKLSCLQNVKFVHLRNVSIESLASFLVSVESLKKIKLLKQLQPLLSPFLVGTVEARGCRIRWVEKPAAAP